ncbi:MAG: 2-hydroxyacyl-CoA dehydratase family protein [bacterium]|nr:2-hydroxyacyl-CoA dehydratase family protein [bacterium]
MKPKPLQIDYREWHQLFKQVPDQQVETTRYYRQLDDAPWSQYLFPPSTHAVYGNRLLRKLHFDNSPAALRLWGFVLSEGERIFRARQAGMKIIAPMGDLGCVTPLIYSFPNTIAFYPDCLWWTPFLMESHVLFDDAAELGLGEDSCFVRAALGAFFKQAYFPKPDLCIGTVGATCDDMAAVMSEVDRMEIPIYYFELPPRSDVVSDQTRWVNFLGVQYGALTSRLEEVTGAAFSVERFRAAVLKVNRLRRLIAEIKKYAASLGPNPMGAVEMMNVEFAALSYYGDLDECVEVLQDFKDCVQSRAAAGEGYRGQELRIVWVTPPADPLLMNYVEELGGRVVGSEYVINQTTPILKEEGDPFTILAEAQLAASLAGSTAFRVKLILEQLKSAGADGVIISGIFGSSHCPYETIPIVEALRKQNVPVLSFDVVAPGKMRLQSQIYNRIEAFMESLRARKRRHAG